MFWHSAEHGKMQKQLSEIFFSSRLLLTSQSATVPSRLLHPSTASCSRSIWSSANWPSKRRCSKDVNGLYQTRQIRRESSVEIDRGAEKEKQRKAPWHREGSDIPPVARQRSAGAMVKGSRIPVRASTLTDVRPRKAIDNTVSPSQAHHTSHDY